MTAYQQDSFFDMPEPSQTPGFGEPDMPEPSLDELPIHDPVEQAPDLDATEPASAAPAANAEASPEPVPTAAPEASPAPMHDPGQAAVDSFFGPARLDRPRLERPPLVPRWVWIGIAAVIVVVLAILGGVWLYSARNASIATPTLTGIDVGVARTRLAEQGLNLKVSEQRFSLRPAQTVLSQTPAPGTQLRRGATVAVVISAGTEQFALPNVIGEGLLLAQGQLETKGLVIRVTQEPSQEQSDTVLSSNPPAGQLVHTGDTIQLTVAAPGPQSTLLLPYDMRGVTIVLDPAPVNDGLSDVPLDIARRVRSLIEASNGVVRTTRALADTSTLEAAPERAKRAADGTSTVAVGLSVAPSGAGGLSVYTPSLVLPNASASTRLGTQLKRDLTAEVSAVRSATSTTDTVLAAANAPWARVQLGSFAHKADVVKFADPNWEDTVARAIYRALGTLYGKKPAGT